MTRDEVKRIIQIMCTTYPNFHPANLSDTVDVWAMMLEDFTYQEISLALKAYILTDTSGFAPSVGALVQKVRRTEDLNELEAWSLVSKALRNGTYGAEEEFAKLPPIVQKAVGGPSNLRQWAQTDADSVENVIQSNFVKTYRNVAKREQEALALPESMRAAIGTVADRVQIEQKPPQNAPEGP
jgi:hypothetical protein